MTNISSIHNSGEKNLIIANRNNSLDHDTDLTATFQVTFEPQSKGTKTIFLSIIISNHDDENPDSFAVRGIGLEAEPPSFDSSSITGTTAVAVISTTAGVSYQFKHRH